MDDEVRDRPAAEPAAAVEGRKGGMVWRRLVGTGAAGQVVTLADVAAAAAAAAATAPEREARR